MDMIEEGFRPKYEAICVGNKPADAQHVFFECLLLEEGLGTCYLTRYSVNLLTLGQDSRSSGTATHLSDIQTTPEDPFVTLLLALSTKAAKALFVGTSEGLARHHDEFHTDRARQIQQTPDADSAAPRQSPFDL